MLKSLNALMLVALIMFIMAALISLPVMLLWDWLMPTIFKLPEITWFQAWGITFLSALLFKSNVTVNK